MNFKLILLMMILSINLLSAIQSKPLWITKTPEIDDYLYGVGGPAKDLKEATNMAYEDISRSISVEFKSIVSTNKNIEEKVKYGRIIKKDYERELNDEYNKSIEAGTSAKLFGVKIKERWEDKFKREWWVLAEFPKKNIEMIIKEKTIFIDSIIQSLKEISQENNKNIDAIIIGNFTLKDKKVSSELSYYLESLLTSIIINNKYFKIYQKEYLLKDLKNNNINSNILLSNSQLIGNSKLLNNAKAIITGEYWKQNENIAFFFYLTDLKSGQIIASKSFDVPSNRLPDGINFEPENISEVKKINEEADKVKVTNNLKIDVWTDKGTGGIYKVGENMLINVRSSEECYIKIFYITADGEFYLIFPNKFEKSNFIKKGRVYTLGDEKYSFDFKITPPYGTEMIKVIASKKEFSDIKNTDFSNNIIAYGKLRGISVVSKFEEGLDDRSADGIASCNYTIIKD